MGQTEEFHFHYENEFVEFEDIEIPLVSNTSPSFHSDFYPQPNALYMNELDLCDLLTATSRLNDQALSVAGGERGWPGSVDLSIVTNLKKAVNQLFLTDNEV